MWTGLMKCVLSISLNKFSKRLVLPNSADFKTHLKLKDDLVILICVTKMHIENKEKIRRNRTHKI